MVMAAAGSEMPLSQRALGAKRIFGVSEGNSVPKVFIPQLIRYYKQGRFPVDKLMKFYSFDQINEAMDDSNAGRAIKAVVRMD